MSGVIEDTCQYSGEAEQKGDDEAFTPIEFSYPLK